MIPDELPKFSNPQFYHPYMGIILSFLDCSKDEIVCYIEISELSITYRDYMLNKIHLLKLIYV